jgi:ADP-ribose pyrophosphatase YjhB (NUDIX family)
LAAQAAERPRIRVAALITLDGRVVLVRHRRGPAVYHLLPGGGVDYRETLEHAVIREVLEETGLEVSLGRLLFASDTIDPNGTRHVVNLTFEAIITGGQITSSPKDPAVEAVDLVSPESLGGLDLRPPIAGAIQSFLAGGQVESGYLGSLFSEGR